MFQQMSQMMSLLKNAREMQAKMEAMQERLKDARVTAESDDGSIRIAADGLGEIVSIDCVHGTDVVARLDEMRDLVNSAIRQAKDLHMQEMGKLSEGMDVPGLQEALKKFSP